MNARIVHIASNTFREAVRDRVLYNLIAFALLLSGAAIFVGQISIEIERLVVVNLGLTAVSLFGIVIAIFIGIGLVSKEIEKRTLYTVLSRPVRRWEFIIGKFFGLAATLVVNTFFMAIGVFGALLYVAHKFSAADASILVALYFIILEFLIICSLALLFSSFSSPLLSAVFAFSLFVIGSFADDLRGFAGLTHGITRWLATGAAYLVPNFSALNVISAVAHQQPVGAPLVLQNTLYALFYTRDGTERRSVDLRAQEPEMNSAAAHHGCCFGLPGNFAGRIRSAAPPYRRDSPGRFARRRALHRLPKAREARQPRIQRTDGLHLLDAHGAVFRPSPLRPRPDLQRTCAAAGNHDVARSALAACLSVWGQFSCSGSSERRRGTGTSRATDAIRN